jgi:cytochrome c biogenesis protein
LLGAMLGTIFPQENTFIGNVDIEQYYIDNYGKLGQVYYWLGLSRTFESWWFVGLLVMLGASLVICSLDRVLPLYRALNKQKIRKHLQFIRRQKVTYAGSVASDQDEEWIRRFAEILQKRRYRVRTEEGALFAEKNRFSRWGPYINHIGLIIFLLAALLRTVIPGWNTDEYISVLDGETIPVPGTPYYLKSEGFTVEYYDEEETPQNFREQGRVMAKLYRTDAVLYECVEQCGQPGDEPVLREVHRHSIEVNDPLEYNGLKLYQFDYRLTPQIRAVNAQLTWRESGEPLGKFRLSMDNPQDEYAVGDYRLSLLYYYPDFVYRDGKAATQSNEPNSPVFVFRITGPGLPEEGEIHMYFVLPADKQKYQEDKINQAAGSPFAIGVESMEDLEMATYTSYLNVRTDKGMPLIWTGAAISMIGLVMGFYWQHRRIWLRIDGGQLNLGAHTNKNWYGLKNEVASALKQMDITVDPKSLENGVK